jgi:septal ring factor EnvC (AmiA/AmiB activator)
MAVQQREEAESRAAAERTQQWEAALRSRLSQERDRTEKLRAQLAGLQQQHRQLQEEHRQSQLAAHESEQQIAALKSELAQQREKHVHLTRESLTPPVTASKVHVNQTPRPMAPYGYWGSPSGYRYGGRW